MSNKARDLLKAAKLKKLQTISEPSDYQTETPFVQEETNNTSTDKTSSDEVVVKEPVIQERDERGAVLKEKLALFDKIKKEPQMFKGGSFVGFKKPETVQQPKKLIGYGQKELKEFTEEKEVVTVQQPVEEKDLKEKLMKRISSAKMQKKEVNKEQPKNAFVKGFANELANKFGINVSSDRKKFILEDNDIQKIDTDVKKVIIEEKKDIVDILMEKPVVKVRKMAKREFKL
jgi:hypothetical protein